MSQILEEWIDIPEYVGRYQISSLGNVKSLKRQVKTNRGLRTVKERILKVYFDGGGYSKVALSKDSKTKSFYVHVLVAVAFLGHVPCGFEIVVDHIDENPHNNNLSNLQLLTTRENISKSAKRKSKKTSKYVGVSFKPSKQKWEANIRFKNKNFYLGIFDTEKEASYCYKKAVEGISKNDLYFTEPKKFTSKYKGVSWHSCRNKWRAEVRVNKKGIHLGSFDKEEDAYNSIIIFKQKKH